MFEPYTGEMFGLPTNDKHLVYRWMKYDGHILFSVSELADGLSCHFASDKKGRRRLKEAIVAFCEFCHGEFKNGGLIVAKIGSQGIVRMVNRVGFKTIYSDPERKIWVCVGRHE